MRQQGRWMVLHSVVLFAFILGASVLWAQTMHPLEGSFGHGPPPGGLHELEGDFGHAPPPVSATAATAGPSAAGTAEAGGDILCESGQVCVVAATQLPLRAIPRPFAHVYAEPQADPQQIRIANIPSFHPLYVFARQDVDLSGADQDQGWYQVGRSTTQAEGWMQASDVIEWRQPLIVSYTHPGGLIEGRNPVLMFRDYESLADLVDDYDMSRRARDIYRAMLDSGQPPASVISREPERFVNIREVPYIIPILQWEQTRIDGDNVRLLQIAAAVPGERGATTIDDPEYMGGATAPRGEGERERLQNILADVVFVIDTTRSMQPFIDMTMEALERTIRQFEHSLEADRVRFGLVTFRDSIEVIPQLEYDVRNWTPELVDARTLQSLLRTDVHATNVGSLDYAEEVFAGVDEAINSQWRDGALRFMILIGDASSHPKGHPQNITGKDETDLRREMDSASIKFYAIHLQDPRATEDHPIAEAQFQHLSRIPGTRNESAYEFVDAFDEPAFLQLIDAVTNGLVSLVAEAAGDVVDTDQGGADVPNLQNLQTVNRLWEAALVEYVGRDAMPPRDIVAWVLDRDLVYPVDRAFQVHLLVTREQLNSLAQSVDQVLQALMRAEATQSEFFSMLQNVAGQAMQRPEDLGQAQQLADTGLLPSFIQNLPYRSNILTLTEEMFASMTAAQRSQLEWDILAKVQQYRAINESVDRWWRLNEGDADSEMVYPLEIEYLP